MSKTADSSNTSRGAKARRPNLLPTAVLLAGAVAAYGVIAFEALFNGQTSASEISYLVKSWWYASGLVAPYTATDATGGMPLYFLQLGFWQQVQGLGHIPARVASIGMGVVSGLLLFAICKRLTANTLAATAAVFIFLGTPATAFSFAMATPAATVSALHLAAIALIVFSLGKPRPWATALMGALCAVMYFYKQHMLLAVVVLVPLYIAAIGRQRALHAAILLAAAAAVTAAILLSFPDKLTDYALRLPLISPLLEQAGLLAPNFVLIDRGTADAITMGPAFDRFSPTGLLDTFLLPYSGTIIVGLALLGLTVGPLRVLWIAPLYFLWLALGHYLSTLGFCDRCMLNYTPYFSAVGALGAALALAMFAHRMRAHAIPAGPPILVGAAVAVALNTFAPVWAVSDDARRYPIPLLAQPYATTELVNIESMARWIAANMPQREPILVLHSLGKNKLASLPYAVFLSGHMIPVQSLDPAGTKRVLNTKLDGAARESVQAAIEEESQWTDETLARWLGRDYDFVLFQEDRTTDQRAVIAALGNQFDVAASTVFRGSNVFLYKRKPVQ
jgi:hypothetical protein